LKFKIALLILLTLSITFIGVAQESLLPISAFNIRQLRSVLHIDFADHQTDAGRIENGWLALSPDGRRMTTMNRDYDVVVWSDDGTVTDRYGITGMEGMLTTIIDQAFSADASLLASIHSEGSAYSIAVHSFERGKTLAAHFDSPDVPFRIWINEGIWFEVAPLDDKPRYVRQISLPAEADFTSSTSTWTPSVLTELPSGPENDETAFLRVGRIVPPFAVTSTQDLDVKRWNLQTAEVTASARLPQLPGMGQLTPDGRYFAWRDGESSALHRLDFKTGEDQVVAPLDGTYIPFLLISKDGDVIISVQSGMRPVIDAWIVETGEHISLGEYRFCNRQPDVVRVNRAGTTLVIGCDTGLDVWRIVPVS